MKKSLFLYLFIIALLMFVFTYSYYSKKIAFESDQNAKTITKLKDSLNSMSIKLEDANYFDLENNTRAQNYLDNNFTADFTKKVSDALLAFNDSNEGNSYTGQTKMGEQKFIINKMKILNHRWIVADFSNGKLWGEVVLKYFINEDKTISFEILNSYLYPLQLN